jgi:basic membrane protein A and related proteins
MIRKAILTFAAAAAIAVAFTGCGHRAGGARAGQETLGMVTDVGGLGDKSFNDSAHAGLIRAEKELGARTQVLQSRSAADYQPNLTALTNQHLDMIYAIGYLMNRDLDQVAKANTSQHYSIIDAVVPDPNVVSVTFKEQDGSFLAGALAAMMSKSHHIAFLGGMDIPLLRKFEAGYSAGAHQIDPKVKVDVKYVNSFDDVAAGQEIANLLYNGGADIVFAAAGKAGLGAMNAVKSRNDAYVIGVDSDQDDIVPGKVLTSMIKHVDVAVFDVARAIKEKKPLNGHLELGLDDQGISLSDFRNTRDKIGPDRLARLDAIQEAIIKGRVNVPSTREELASWKPVKL